MLRACWHDLRMRQGYVYILASQRNGTLYTRRNVEVYPRHLKVKADTETASQSWLGLSEQFRAFR